MSSKPTILKSGKHLSEIMKIAFEPVQNLKLD